MDDNYKRKLSAYERRKINSQKIAQVQFSPEDYSYEKKHKMHEYKQYEYERYEKHPKEKNVPKAKSTENWTVIDQVKEEQLWDE